MPSAARIFAALDSAGEIRFIGDVASGAACACYCSVCGSPVIARHGSINTWHFAHEALQERPECVAGAMNLLRRLAVQYLRTLPKLILPRYEREVFRHLRSGRVSETVGWSTQPLSVTWLEVAAQEAPVAHLSLDNGTFADLWIDVSDRVSIQPHPSESRRGRIVFWTTLPVDSDLRKEIYVLQHLRQRGQLHSLYQPDVFGILEAAQRRLNQRYADEEQLANERVELQAKATERRFLPIHGSHSPDAPGSPDATPTLPAWTNLKKLNRPFFGYRLRDGSAWTLFELASGGYGVRCLNEGEEGWEEAIPASVGVFYPDLDIVISRSPSEPQAFFEMRRTATRISSTLADVLVLRDGSS